MNSINLLPPEERPGSSRSLVLSFMGITALFALFLAISLVQWWQASSLERQSQELASQYQLLRPSVERMNAANEKAAAINAKNTILLLLSNGRPVWYGVLTPVGGQYCRPECG